MNVINYNIRIDVDFGNKKYNGSEHIKIKEAEKEIKFDLYLMYLFKYQF